MNTFKKGELPEGFVKGSVELGDKIELGNQTQEVVKCIESGVLMLNIDADQLQPGDLSFIKKLGLTISNPETDKPVALGVEYRTFGRKLADWFETDTTNDDDDDDDSSFFSPTPSTGGSFFGGSSGFGGFGGFGGGFGVGGGASRGF